MIWLEWSDQLAGPLAKGAHLIYKHSPACGYSDRALGELAAFRRSRPEIPIYAVDVIHHQEVSRALVLRLEVGHESPQVFVMQGGRVVWHASHHRVTAVGILGALAQVDVDAVGAARNG